MVFVVVEGGLEQITTGLSQGLIRRQTELGWKSYQSDCGPVEGPDSLKLLTQTSRIDCPDA